MYTTESYSKAFWNSMKSNRIDDISLNEGRNTTNGSYFLPSQSAEKYKAALEKENLFRRLATVANVPSSGGRIITSDTPIDAAWIGEGGSVPEAELAVTRFMLDEYKLACITMLDSDFVRDTGFDISNYLTLDFARIFGKAEEDSFLNGDGVDKPKGVLHATEGADVGVTAASPTGIAFDEIQRLYFSLKPEYRSNAVWVMNDETALGLRDLKDSTNNFLWRGAADTLLGKPVVISNHMPSAASGKKPVVFGDFKYYWIAQREPLSVRALHEKYLFANKIGYLGIERLDGCLIRSEAIKALQMAE
ncbi:phage major capsid protein [Dehalococcoides sp. THU4]|uniref:phage major capsid protein n=1 Tax=Dehalococcoides sp. THU4 TaxID=3348344 RepID=UPI00370FEA6E